MQTNYQNWFSSKMIKKIRKMFKKTTKNDFIFTLFILTKIVYLNFLNVICDEIFKNDIIIIIKIILDLISFLRRFMRKNYWRLQRKILNENKNLFLYVCSRFNSALIEFLRRIIAWWNCHHHFLSLCLLSI
jgi:MFS superfamily sulfate permease-like transporter